MEEIDQSDMLEDLRKVYSLDPEAKLLQIVSRCLSDPLNPQDANGTFRPHPLLVQCATIGFVVVGFFIYFTYFQP